MFPAPAFRPGHSTFSCSFICNSLCIPRICSVASFCTMGIATTTSALFGPSLSLGVTPVADVCAELRTQTGNWRVRTESNPQGLIRPRRFSRAVQSPVCLLTHFSSYIFSIFSIASLTLSSTSCVSTLNVWLDNFLTKYIFNLSISANNFCLSSTVDSFVIKLASVHRLELRPRVLETRMLPLHHTEITGALGEIRTPNLVVRSHLL